MSDPVVQFESVSKEFRLVYERPGTLQETLIQRLRRGKPQERDRFWAVRDVSFDIRPGETVGLVGPNGAGKSTLLKLTSRILAPTRGRVRVRGRVSSLLELGAGFHPDLSGRENIYFNGSLIGLSRVEMRSKLETIVDFSELGNFIDVPVRHYSSGMYMRLGFSIAVHVDPDILLVDEVLAVGDAAFQQKCMQKIDQLRQQNVTILFVSHSMDAVKGLCRRLVWMKDGRVEDDGLAEAVVQKYLWESYQRGSSDASDRTDRRWGTRRIEIEQVVLLADDGRQEHVYRTGEPLLIEIHFRAQDPVAEPIFGLGIHRSDGVHLSGPNTGFAGLEIPQVQGRGVVRHRVPSLTLLEGAYLVSVSCHNKGDTEMYDYHDRLYSFQVMPAGGERYGLLTLQGSWSWESKDSVAKLDSAAPNDRDRTGGAV